MAYNRRYINHGGGPEAPNEIQVITYDADEAGDNEATVEGAGYFNDMVDIWKTGSLLYVNYTSDGALYRITNSGTAISIAQAVAGATPVTL